MRISVLIGAGLMLAGTHAAHAQCADGSPPPCARARVASATVRKDPALDDKTWIVVPFNNVTRAPDVDYLRDASVNLLYLDMSRWSDIRVVDDARVADLLRETPGADKLPLSLDVATAIAKRAGAGRLVMGNIIKQGSRTTIAAKVFDVRRTAVIRSPQQDLVAQDSLMSVFGKLAGAILNVAPPAGQNIADVGTSRVDAYQAYLQGAMALKRFDLPVARTHLDEALRLDSTFALAHYRLAVLIGWVSPNDTMKVRHAAIAARLGVGLPARERTLIKGLNEFEQREYDASCKTYGSLVKADSTDVEALYGIGECSYHDSFVVASATDTSRSVHRGTWNTAIRVFERVIELDPTYHLAYQHILDALSAERRSGFDLRLCPKGGSDTRCSTTSYPRRDGDSLLMVPVSVVDTGTVRAQAREFLRSDSRRRNLLLARARAAAWVDNAPDERRAHIELGHLQYLLGEYAAAEQQFAFVRGMLTNTESGKVFPDRIDMAIKRGRGDLAVRLTDSLILAQPGASGPRSIGMLFGRMGAIDSTLRAQMGRSGASKVVADYVTAMVRDAVSGGDARTDSLEHQVLYGANAIAGANLPKVATAMPAYLFAPRRPRTWIPLEYNGDPRNSAIVALSKGDTARLRVETRAIDSTLRAKPPASPDSGAGVLAAELYLALRDSVSALRVVRMMLDTTMMATPLVSTALFGNFGGGLPALAVWARLSLLRADLESAVGAKDAAREWYKRFLLQWENADAEYQPVVQRARKSLAALGP